MFFSTNKKNIFGFLTLFSIFLIAAAYYFQHVVGLKPCFLCIVQRIAVIFIGLSSFVLYLSEIKFNFSKYLAYPIYIGASVLGLFSAIRQMYMQRFPDPYVSCGSGYEYILENNSIAKSIPQLFMATGNCSEVDWSFIGLSMAEWMIPIFIGYIIVVLYILFKKAV